MTAANFEESFEIYLFTKEMDQDNFSNLSEFISFLKFNRITPSYKFSYVGRGESLIPELSLNENILMDFSPNSLTASKDLQFQEFLKEAPNKELEKLYQKIISPHAQPAHSDTQMKQVTSLIKALVFEGEFIFLEEPENDLDMECLELFISALKDHIIRHKKNVFIFSNNLKLWLPHSHKHVKREKNYQFTINDISQKSKWPLERQAFYSSIKEHIGIPQTQLKFHLPKNLKAKKRAA